DITIADLAATRRNPSESVADYITRWRNLSIKCERPLEQPEALKLLLKNIDNWMAPFLCSSGARTFQELISHASQLEKMNPKDLFPQPDKAKIGGSNGRKSDNKKGVAAVLSTEVAKKQDAEQPRPVFGTTQRRTPEERKAFLEEKAKKVYPFKREKVAKIFRDALANGVLELPATRFQDPENKAGKTLFCPYHRCPGHVIEDCFMFKDWLEKMYKEGKISLSQSALQDPANQQVSFVAVDFEPKTATAEVPVERQDEGDWNLVISKQTQKLLRRISRMPGIIWRGTRPADAKHPRKKVSKTRRKKKRTPAAKKELSPLQRYINSLEEYEQTPRMLITLQDFFPEEVKQLLEESSDEEDDFWGPPPMPAVCNAINAVSTAELPD
ncbi:hypothetical protein L8N14_017235, partial [Serratia marcescens]|nr:hypothetical protein [Serratia marcescens]